MAHIRTQWVDSTGRIFRERLRGGLETFGRSEHPKSQSTMWSKVLAACVATDGQMLVRHHTTDVHSCSRSHWVSYPGISHLWFMSHGTLTQCVQCTSHGCSCPLSLSFYQSEHMTLSTLAKKQTAPVSAVIFYNPPNLHASWIVATFSSERLDLVAPLSHELP